MKIGLRLKILSVALPSLAALAVTYFVQRRSLQTTLQMTRWIAEVEEPLTVATYHLKAAFAQEETMVLGFLVGLHSRSEAMEAIESSEKIIEESLRVFEKVEAEIPAGVLEKVRRVLTEEDELREGLFEGHGRNPPEEKKLVAAFQAAVETLNQLIEQIHNTISSRNAQSVESLVQRQFQEQRQFEFLFVGAILLSLVLTAVIARVITRPVKDLLAVFKKIQGGDLTVRAEIQTKDEISVLAQGFNAMLDGLAQSQAQLAHSAKMSSLGEMASGIAHEINNPLTVINAVARRLRRMQGEEIPSKEKMGEDLDRLDRTSQRIYKIVQGLKGYSRNSENDPPETVTVKSIINDCQELLIEKFRNSSVELKIKCDEKLSISCRPSQIFQVIMNLLGNARDAVESFEERWVAIEVGPAPADPAKIWIRVTDSGQGIPEDVLKKLMTPFFTTKPSGKGTGLGLTISQRLAEQHGGRLFYDREHPHTSFVLELPLKGT